jgi:exodeoxyribonuclease VII large subunit
MAALRSYKFEEDEADLDFTTPAPAALTLKQLLDQASDAVKHAFEFPVWVIGEISELSPKGGHVYLTLIEKAENGAITAKLKGNLWASNARAVMHGFHSVTGMPLASGLKVLLQVMPSLHPVYGLSATILAINGEFTLGELERERRLTIERLTNEGLLVKNRGIEMPLVAQKIAVVSSSGAAGYEDFIHQLTRNAYGYAFKVELFHAVVQGDCAPASIVSAFKAIVKRKDEFDIVVVLRGGGAKIDLTCFDNYEVARTIAWTPLPVITGIGHERDDSVADMVAHTRCKTPTAVAEFILGLAADYEESMLEMRERVIRMARTHLHSAQLSVDRIGMQMRQSVQRLVNNQATTLNRMSETVRTGALVMLERERGVLQQAVDKVSLLDPINVLRRGYSLVYSRGSGALLRSSVEAKPGDGIRVQLAKGVLEANVTLTVKQENQKESNSDGTAN